MTHETGDVRQVNLADAREAITKLRDAARQGGMSHFQRDPCVVVLHQALDELTDARVKQLTSQPAPSGWQQLIAAGVCDGPFADGCQQHPNRWHLWCPTCLEALSPSLRPSKSNLETAREWINDQYDYYIDNSRDAANREDFVDAVMQVVEAACVDALKSSVPPTLERLGGQNAVDALPPAPRQEAEA